MEHTWGVAVAARFGIAFRWSFVLLDFGLEKEPCLKSLLSLRDVFWLVLAVFDLLGRPA